MGQGLRYCLVANPSRPNPLESKINTALLFGGKALLGCLPTQLMSILSKIC